MFLEAVQQSGKEKHETARYADVGNIEYRKLDEHRIDEINHIAQGKAIYGIAYAARKDKGKASCLTDRRIGRKYEQVDQQQNAYDERKHAKREGGVREHAPRCPGIMHEAELEHTAKWPRNYLPQLKAVEIGLAQLVKQHP